MEELLKEFKEKQMFGKIMSCQVMMAKNLLKLDVNEDVNEDDNADSNGVINHNLI